MSHHAHQRALRLEVDREAFALMNAVGAQAYWVARRRAEEASSDEMARGWTGVSKSRPVVVWATSNRR